MADFGFGTFIISSPPLAMINTPDASLHPKAT